MRQLFQRGLLLVTLLLGFVFSITAQSTQMIVTLNDGTEKSFTMAENDRVYFENNTSLIVEQGTATDVIPLADIRKISYWAANPKTRWPMSASPLTLCMTS